MLAMQIFQDGRMRSQGVPPPGVGAELCGGAGEARAAEASR
jgi:hypothetical protein